LEGEQTCDEMKDRAILAGKEYTRRYAASFMMCKQCWLVAAWWEKGDDKPPEWRYHGEGDSSLPEPALRLVVERERVER
jgi:hypothetical protein